ncbi:unnamed protein product, partial [Ectocarpus sp. 6 AP-2014]
KEVAAVHGRSAAERPAATGDAFDPAKPPLLLQQGDLSRGVFFFAAGSGGGSDGSVTTTPSRDSDDACSRRGSAAGGFGASSSEASSRQHSSSSTAVVAVGKIEPVFCTTNEAAVGIARNNNHHKIVGGGKKSIPKEAEGPGTRDRRALALEGETGGDKSISSGQQQPKEGQQQQLRQRRAKPSYRRSSSGVPHTAAAFGKAAIAPRRHSVDSAESPALQASGKGGCCFFGLFLVTPVVVLHDGQNKQLVRHLSNSRSFGSLGSFNTAGEGDYSVRNSAFTRTPGLRRKRVERVVILAADMAEQMQEDAKESTARAMEESGDHEDIAAYIKKDFDERHGAKWHCIVGKHFGSFVTAESNGFVHLHLSKVAVLLFKADG